MRASSVITPLTRQPCMQTMSSQSGCKPRLDKNSFWSSHWSLHDCYVSTLNHAYMCCSYKVRDRTRLASQLRQTILSNLGSSVNAHISSIRALVAIGVCGKISGRFLERKLVYRKSAVFCRCILSCLASEVPQDSSSNHVVAVGNPDLRRNSTGWRTFDVVWSG